MKEWLGIKIVCSHGDPSNKAPVTVFKYAFPPGSPVDEYPGFLSGRGTRLVDDDHNVIPTGGHSSTFRAAWHYIGETGTAPREVMELRCPEAGCRITARVSAAGLQRALKIASGTGVPPLELSIIERMVVLSS